MELKPLLITRISSALVWPVLAAVLVIVLYGNDVPLGVVIGVGVVALAAACYLGLFGWRLGVVCDDAGVEVHGLFRNRRIARDQVTSITDFPAVRWKSPDGKSHWTPIFAFTNIHRVMPLVDRHNEAAIAILQQWESERHRTAKADRRQQRRRRQRPAQ
ncbi:hypothetical protein GCM10009554_19310 [Kribbella koreensis]|uniref:PH domain-containing protein n=2 Tax=Kribbella TaxID=182639 RepID=A0ABP6Y2T4_9ACTN